MVSQKQKIRDNYLKDRCLSDKMANLLSGMICDRLTQTLLFREAKCIALYCAKGNEVRTYELMDKYVIDHESGMFLQLNKKFIVLPVISGNNMHFYPYTGNKNLHEGAFGIMEPVSRDLVPPEDIDLFIVPGVAFDLACNRLGRGKGYYDRYLSGIDKPAIGLCYDFQLIDSIPCEPHDKKMTFIITETATVLPKLSTNLHEFTRIS